MNSGSKKEKDEAPSNKASDLNTAVSWLLTRSIEDLPIRIKSAARELRQKIQAGEINRITLWYSHNLPESENVKQELKSAENTLSSIVGKHFSGQEIETHALEVGLNTVESWYQSLTIPILMTDDIILDQCDGFISNGCNWTSFTTSFPAKYLYKLYQIHSTNLF